MISANEIPYFRKTTPINAASRIPSSLRFAARFAPPASCPAAPGPSNRFARGA
jgi:hypothetical protein